MVLKKERGIKMDTQKYDAVFDEYITSLRVMKEAVTDLINASLTVEKNMKKVAKAAEEMGDQECTTH
jgi:hypothetical protein